MPRLPIAMNTPCISSSAQGACSMSTAIQWRPVDAMASAITGDGIVSQPPMAGRPRRIRSLSKFCIRSFQIKMVTPHGKINSGEDVVAVRRRRRLWVVERRL